MPVHGQELNGIQRYLSFSGFAGKTFRKTVNKYLLDKSRSTDEDRLENAAFRRQTDWPLSFLLKRELNSDTVQDAVIEKVLFYLQFDVLKYEPMALFKKA